MRGGVCHTECRVAIVWVDGRAVRGHGGTDAACVGHVESEQSMGGGALCALEGELPLITFVNQSRGRRVVLSAAMQVRGGINMYRA